MAKKPKKAAPKVPASGVSMVSGTISKGTSLSAAITCGGGSPRMLIMPAAWDAAMVTFQVSPDGTSFFDVFRPDGTESEVSVTPGVGVMVPPGALEFAVAIKVRSGTRAVPTIQTADRKFSVVLF